MALCNSKSSTLFQIHQSQPILFLNFFRLSIFLLFLHFPFTNSFSFNFSSFQPGDSAITYEGDAYAANGIIQVTTVSTALPTGQSTGSVGRAYYSTPIHLWDSDTGNLTDFITHFSFNITASEFPDIINYGDGLAFFLSPINAKLPNDSGGGYLGLFENSTAMNGIHNHIVAVEFDTYPNAWDPKPWEQSINHVGIDVNSIQSTAYLIWNSSFVDSTSTANAWVSYNSSTMVLSVYLTYDQNPVFQANNFLSYVVNLTEVLPEWVNVGFSAAASASAEIHSILSWTFQSTLGGSYNSTPTSHSTPTSNSTFPGSSSNSTPTSNSTFPGSSSNSTSRGSISTGTGHKTTMRLVAGLLVSIGVLLSWGVCLFWLMKRRKTILREKNKVGHAASTEDTRDFEIGTGPRRYTYSELEHATHNFSKEGKLGEGGFGVVYKGVLGENQEEIAVKRISETSKQGKKEYESEVKVISRLSHINLVQLIGWCHERADLLLVYEFMPNGSLDTHLSAGNLSWTIRHKIAVGLASAVHYLHEEGKQYVIHRDIKSSNVMLDASYNAKLGDFGLARLVDHELVLDTTRESGTLGYFAPEIIKGGKASKKSDVYSFGVVALEIASGRKPIEFNLETGNVTVLAGWVWSLYEKGQLFEAVDKDLRMESIKSQVERLMLVGLGCCHPNPKHRLSIKQAKDLLSSEAPLPDLPPQMPKPPLVMPTDSFKDADQWFFSSDGQSPQYLLKGD